MDYAEIGHATPHFGNRRGRRLVDGMCSLAAAETQQRGTSAGRARNDAKELRTHRHTDDARVAEVALGLFEVDSRRRNPPAYHAVGESGNIVRLKSQRRNAVQDGCGHGRSGSVSTHTDHYLRTKSTDNLARVQNRQGKAQQRPQAGNQVDVLERAYFDERELKSSLRHQTVLQAADRAYEQYLRVLAGLEFAGDSQRRNNVSAGATPREEDPALWGRRQK